MENVFAIAIVAVTIVAVVAIVFGRPFHLRVKGRHETAHLDLGGTNDRDQCAPDNGSTRG